MKKIESLRTLKDLIFVDCMIGYPSDEVIIEILKDEAIKWIKEMGEFKYKEEEGDSCIERYEQIIKDRHPDWIEDLDIYSPDLITEIRAMRNILKHFCNVTEEDLNS